MGRKKIAAGNWKMNTSLEEGLQLARDLANANRPAGVQTILGIPYTHLKTIYDQTMHVPGLEVAAQNCHYMDSGAYTGEISAEMLLSIGIEYVIIGHSERRQYFGETDEILNKKLKKVLEKGLIPIFCCGESLATRKDSLQNEFVVSQIKAAFKEIPTEDIRKIIIAYEPIWAIGTGETASPNQVQEMHKVIRNHLAVTFGESIASEIPILYGGSVKETNAKELFSQEDVDGGLVGGASLKFDSFNKIIHSF